MLRTLTKTLGGAMAVLCLASTFALAQGQPQTMVCMKDNGKGVCTAATTAEGKDILVVGPGLERGDTMTCVDRGTVVDCRPAFR